MSYTAFKSSVLGKHIGDNECVSLVVNNAKDYCEYLFPGVTWTSIIKPVSGARQLLQAANSKYFTVIKNDHSNANQLPKPGDVMVFDATPKSGYTNTYNNPYGHTGICDKANAAGYWLLQQNSPLSNEYDKNGKIIKYGSPAAVTYYPWNYRPCLGWLRPIPQKAATPPVAATTTKGGDMITNNDTMALRAVMRDIKGWDEVNVNAGKYDASEKKAWVGHTWDEYIADAIKNGAAYRSKRAAAFDYYAKKSANDKALTTAQGQVTKLQTQLDEQSKAQPSAALDAATKAEIDSTNTIVKQIWSKVSGIFK